MSKSRHKRDKHQGKHQGHQQKHQGKPPGKAPARALAKGGGDFTGRESEGFVKRHPDGFGFFISDNVEDPDVYIPRQAMKGVMTNDRVRVKIERERGGDRFRGEIIEITKRFFSRVMGQYHELGPGRGMLFDKSFGWGDDLRASCPPDIAVKNGELVVVQVEEYPDSARGFTGRVITVIGDAADPLNDAPRMLHAHNIPFEFSRATLKEAEQIPEHVTERDWAGRKDLRGIPIITIDGKTAKDFDDAVYVEKTSGGFRLIVAIADVSHYVKPGSAIDEDAYLRGTSTYFPNFVAPMLPEKLSNELCSLKPNVPRLALVAEMQFDFQGEMTASQFYEAVIQSQARVTYGEAQEVIEGADVPRFHHVRDNILRCADLAKILMAKRFREGSLDLELPETEIEVDETGTPVDIFQSERLFAHRLIEELMLMANVAVARFFKEHHVEALYRIHEEPAAEAMENFNAFLRAFGYKQKLSTGHLQKKIGQALQFFADHPKSHVLNMLALRSLAQAKYSPNNVGHFGLGFADYAHFTSPIRRYPDLIVHRQLKSKLYAAKGYRPMTLEELESAGTMLSGCEQRSVKAERQIKSIKKARFMLQHLGEEFEGLISSVARFGMFVMLRQFDVDGLLRMEELGGDRFEFDEEKMRLVGRKSGMAYEIGDVIKIVVAKVDVEMGQIDFVLSREGKSVSKPTAAMAEGASGAKPAGMPESRSGGSRGRERERGFRGERAERGRDGGRERARGGSARGGSDRGGAIGRDRPAAKRSTGDKISDMVGRAVTVAGRSLSSMLSARANEQEKEQGNAQRKNRHAGGPKRGPSKDDSRGVRKSRVQKPRRSR